MSDIVHNKLTFIREIEARTGYHVGYTCFWKWEQKGYIKADGRMLQGKRTVPFYKQKTVDKFIARIPVLKEQGKLKLRKSQG